MFESSTLPELPSAAACATEELVGLMAAHARAESMHAQRKLAVVAELQRRREAQDATAGVRTGRLGEFTVAEVAVGLTVSKAAADGFLHVGTALAQRLPLTRLAFARGELDFTRVRAIVERTTHLDDAVVALVEPRVLDVALRPGRELTRARLVTALDRIVAEVDPDGVRERRRRAQDDRDVQVRADTDGMASLWGLLPAVDGAALDSRLGQLAQSVCSADPRSLAQRRADALTALALGADHLACACADPGCPCPPETAPRPRVLLQVSIDATTLAGAAELPGVLAGLGVIDPEVVRTLAADATWQRLLTHHGAVTAVDPAMPGGAVPAAAVPAAAHRYTPGAALARLVRARDAHCRFPGCAVPAGRCDLDHVIPFHHPHPAAGGPTAAANLQCLCRFHHRLKTRGDWQVHTQPGAVMRWTSPTGTTHDTSPGDSPAAGGAENAPPDWLDDPPPSDLTAPDPWDGTDWRHLLDADPVSEGERHHHQHGAPPSPWSDVLTVGEQRSATAAPLVSAGADPPPF